MILRRIKRKLYKLTHPALADVWMLHRVITERSDVPHEWMLEVTPEGLRRRIERYRDIGGRFVSLDTLMQELQEPSPHRQPTASVTFDEGCRETLEHIVPLFQDEEIPFTLFVTTDFVDNAHPIGWYNRQPTMMSWDELVELSHHPLCTIGAHTVTHPHLCQLSQEQAFFEVMLSKQILEDRLNIPIRYFSYPFGERNAAVMECVRQAGYTAAFEAWGGAVRTGADRYNLPRIPFTSSI